MTFLCCNLNSNVRQYTETNKAIRLASLVANLSPAHSQGTRSFNLYFISHQTNMRCFLLACILVLFLLSLVLLGSAFGGEDDGSSGRRSMNMKARKCRGVEIKPTRRRAAMDAKCRKTFPSSPRCARLCRLEKTTVIRSGKVFEKAWRSYAEYSYPHSIIGEVVPKMKDCGALYSQGTNSTSSPDCVENEKFITCLGTAVDEVCAGSGTKA